jgi:putative membrane protein
MSAMRPGWLTAPAHNGSDLYAIRVSWTRNMPKKWWTATRDVLGWELRLLRIHRKLALALAGVLFVPAIYAWIYLFAMWDPASHTRDLPAGLVNLDTGAQYRGRSLNLGSEVLVSIEAQGHFAYRRYQDAQEARRDARQGRLAFVLEIPADFSERALPGETRGAAKLTLYTSEGNNYASAGFARRFAPEVAQRVNPMLAEARWDLVLSTAAAARATRVGAAEGRRGARGKGLGVSARARLCVDSGDVAAQCWGGRGLGQEGATAGRERRTRKRQLAHATECRSGP